MTTQKTNTLCQFRLRYFFPLALLLGLLGTPYVSYTQDVDPDLLRLQEQQRKTQEAISRLNRLNAFSPDYKPGATPPQNPSQDALALAENLLSNPAIQKPMKFLASPEFSKLIRQIQTSPDKMNLLYAQTGWLFFLFLFKAWRRSRMESSQWIRGLWLTLWTSVLYLGSRHYSDVFSRRTLFEIDQ